MEEKIGRLIEILKEAKSIIKELECFDNTLYGISEYELSRIPLGRLDLGKNQFYLYGLEKEGIKTIADLVYNYTPRTAIISLRIESKQIRAIQKALREQYKIDWV